jgi:hypothetical protein
LLSLGKHYSRAEFSAHATGAGALEVTLISNVRRFALSRPVTSIRIVGQEVPLPPHAATDTLVFSHNADRWQCDGSAVTLPPPPRSAKSPGLQGPIDDAFATAFLCVRGTGKPWNPEVQHWAEAGLRRFEYEWARYMRGRLPVKDDTAVTEADLKEKHLILFGDPGSNVWIAKALPALPLGWTPSELRLGGATVPSAQNAPALICANPLAPNHYLVLNSGHTFHEKEFAAYNYLLFPRLGDWAVMKVLPEARDWQPSALPFPEEVLRAGYFDENWLYAPISNP